MSDDDLRRWMSDDRINPEGRLQLMRELMIRQSTREATMTCASEGVPAGAVERERCEEIAVACSRVDEAQDWPASYCRACIEERSGYGERVFRLPNLIAGLGRLGRVQPV